MPWNTTPGSNFSGQPSKIIGNLPYYLSSALLFHFTADPCPFEHMVFTVQKEMADRLSAPPGEQGIRKFKRNHSEAVASDPVENSAPFGISSAAAGRFCCSFVKAASAWRAGRDRCRKFSELVKAGFSERRKQVRKLLGRYGDAERVEAPCLRQAFL